MVFIWLFTTWYVVVEVCNSRSGGGGGGERTIYVYNIVTSHISHCCAVLRVTTSCVLLHNC